MSQACVPICKPEDWNTHILMTMRGMAVLKDDECPLCQSLTRSNAICINPSCDWMMWPEPGWLCEFVARKLLLIE